MRITFILLAGSFGFSSLFAQSQLQKTANSLNQGSYETINTINAASNTLNAAKQLGEMGKSLNLFPKKKKGNKKDDNQNQPTDNNQTGATAQTPAATSSVTVIMFDKIDFMKLKKIKDSLVANKKVVSAKTSFNTPDGSFITVEHTTDSDELAGVIMERWSDDFTIASSATDKIVLNSK